MSALSSTTLPDTGALAGWSREAAIGARELMEQRCDVLAPCAIERVIDADVARRLNCRIIAEGANGPTTPEADRVLAERNDEIFVIPDILCNAGGVIVSYFEWVQDLQQYFWSKDEVMDRLERALDRSWIDGRRAQPSATGSRPAPPRWRSELSACGRPSRRGGFSREQGRTLSGPGSRRRPRRTSVRVRDIYAHYVLNSLATFEEVRPR